MRLCELKRFADRHGFEGRGEKPNKKTLRRFILSQFPDDEPEEPEEPHKKRKLSKIALPPVLQLPVLSDVLNMNISERVVESDVDRLFQMSQKLPSSREIERAMPQKPACDIIVKELENELQGVTLLVQLVYGHQWVSLTPELAAQSRGICVPLLNVYPGMNLNSKRLQRIRLLVIDQKQDDPWSLYDLKSSMELEKLEELHSKPRCNNCLGYRDGLLFIGIF